MGYLLAEDKRKYNLYWKKANPERYLFISAKHRAKKTGKSFEIEVSDVSVPSHCPVLGIPLFFIEHGRSDNSPSIDRIDNEKGYTRDNIRVISWRANHMKKAYTIDEIEKLLAYMKE